ncbi:hypothetical protein T4B_1298 [Trichinella pseudospiralis]|uniref:Uncharacterized protein n=1 Tax=Trichinella pseudospiralis TaxID=6337 RepID=A0A0V1ILC3_TRIPS|nr:hypothetical protein T4B_1298 [Trichinella pseudospiralis]KRZ29428.1 hypothetical protein T4C_6406 [Trichinella pseudospiralis]
MLSVLLQVGDVSLHPLILCITFTLLFQSEAMDRSVPAIENVIEFNINFEEKFFTVIFFNNITSRLPADGKFDARNSSALLNGCRATRLLNFV